LPETETLQEISKVLCKWNNFYTQI